MSEDEQAPAPDAGVVALLRRYVTRFVNAHDFTAIPGFMADDYTLFTSGHTITGRDGPYADAVRRQMAQFPGLVFTPHLLLHVGNRVAIHFTEHGASITDGGTPAAWPSIGIYTIRAGRLASCHIEQDYLGRRRQLLTSEPYAVETPATAPWDTLEAAPDAEAEAAVRRWLRRPDLQGCGVDFDDVAQTGLFERIIDNEQLEILQIVAGEGRVGFHAVMQGGLVGDFAPELAIPAGTPATLHLAGLVRVDDGEVVGGRVLRDRWGFYRRLAANR